PTMELPILYALTHPARVPDAGTRRFDPVAAGSLTFEAVEAELYPAYGLGRAAATAGGTAPTVFNAANEIAVALVLEGGIPFGGYVKMAGFEDEGVAGDLEGGKSAQPIDPARAFDRKPLWARSIVILAGVTMNAVFAVVVYTGLAYTGTLEPNNIATTRVDSVMVNDLPPAAQVLGALRRGDRITTVNGDSVRTWGDLQLKLANAPPPVRLRVAGRPDSVVLQIAQGDTAARV